MNAIILEGVTPSSILFYRNEVTLMSEILSVISNNYGWKDMEDPYWAGYKIIQ